MTPCDLEKIKERLKLCTLDHANDEWNSDFCPRDTNAEFSLNDRLILREDAPALIAEVEALRKANISVNETITRTLADKFEARHEVTALRAKLEYALGAFNNLRANETVGSFRSNGNKRLDIIKEALAKLKAP